MKYLSVYVSVLVPDKIMVVDLSNEGTDYMKQTDKEMD